MKIRVSDTRPEGVTLEGTIPRNSLNQRLEAAKSNDISILDDPRYSIRFKRTLSGAEIKGSLTFNYLSQCSRCMSETQKSKELPLSMVFQEVPPDKIITNPLDYFEEDVGLAYYENDEIDLEDFLQEQLILNIELYSYCNPTCKGICAKCGKNLNEGDCSCPSESSGFGTLLKNAIGK